MVVRNSRAPDGDKSPGNEFISMNAVRGEGFSLLTVRESRVLAGYLDVRRCRLEAWIKPIYPRDSGGLLTALGTPPATRGCGATGSQPVPPDHVGDPLVQTRENQSPKYCQGGNPGDLDFGPDHMYIDYV